MSFATRSAFACLVAVALCGGCRSAKKAMFVLPSAPLGTRLPPMESAVDIGPLADNDGALFTDPQKLFDRELQLNLTEPYQSANYGYAKLTVREVETHRTGKVLQVFQIITLMMPTFLGVPLEWYNTDMQAEVEILNARGETVGTYAGAGRSHVRVAMYHGFSQGAAPRLADVDAIKRVLAQIRPQLESDAVRLNQELRAAGPNSDPNFGTDSLRTNPYQRPKTADASEN